MINEAGLKILLLDNIIIAFLFKPKVYYLHSCLVITRDYKLADIWLQETYWHDRNEILTMI